MTRANPGMMGRPPKISREQILDTVLAIGFDEATVSEVARRLHVDQSALYRHVNNRESMLREASERAFNRYEQPEPTGNWRDYLTEFAESQWAFLTSIPGLALYLASARYTPHAMTSVALTVTTKLSRYGFTPRDAMVIVDSIADMTTQTIIMNKTLDSTPNPSSGESLRQQALNAIERTAPGLDDTIGFAAEIIELLAPHDETAWWQAKLALILDGAEHLQRN